MAIGGVAFGIVTFYMYGGMAFYIYGGVAFWTVVFYIPIYAKGTYSESHAPKYVKYSYMYLECHYPIHVKGAYSECHTLYMYWGIAF
jgi:hypothetical protein